MQLSTAAAKGGKHNSSTAEDEENITIQGSLKFCVSLFVAARHRPNSGR